jgi:hypothetical protein
MEAVHPPANAAGFSTSSDDVFGRIASRYDLLCDLFSLCIHRHWKRRVAKLIAQEPWKEFLDVATGTGDIVLRVLELRAPVTGNRGYSHRAQTAISWGTPSFRASSSRISVERLIVATG